MQTNASDRNMAIQDDTNTANEIDSVPDSDYGLSFSFTGSETLSPSYCISQKHIL